MTERSEPREEETLQMLLSQAMRLYFLRNYALLEDKSLHPGQVPVLLELSQSEGLSQIELSRRLHVRPPTVAVMLQRMEKADLIRRCQDAKDQRVIRVYLTDKGSEVHRDVRRMIEEIDRESLVDFTREEVLLLRRFLRQIKENLMAVCDGDMMSPSCRPT